MTPPENAKSAGEMMADILGNVGNLVRNEVDLARAEMTESFARAGSALVSGSVAFGLAITGMNVLAAALVLVAIAFGIPLLWAAGGVAILFLVLAFLTFLSAKSKLHGLGLLPVRAARNLQRDAAAIKEAYNDK